MLMPLLLLFLRRGAQVDPSLPELYVTAGSSALELSQVFCRTYGLGPSQIPLVRKLPQWVLKRPPFLETDCSSGSYAPPRPAAPHSSVLLRE